MNDHPTEPSSAELISRLSDQTSRLIRGELRLAQAEISRKVKHAGLGVGAFGAAGMGGALCFGVLITAGILALNLVLPAWLAAIIVAAVLLVAAAVAALIGKKQVKQATPAVPQQTVDSVKRDVETLKGDPAP